MHAARQLLAGARELLGRSDPAPGEAAGGALDGAGSGPEVDEQTIDAHLAAGELVREGIWVYRASRPRSNRAAAERALGASRPAGRWKKLRAPDVDPAGEPQLTAEQQAAVGAALRDGCR